ncbi:hypothetical protein R1flu_018071 [Riccia fluitans]|uniref:Pentatricopeptide repeat-containing protein n=1 Tax=Riccia fluitans TaxID=41844 RepID=A0ABD1ZES0_9MARC
MALTSNPWGVCAIVGSGVSSSSVPEFGHVKFFSCENCDRRNGSGGHDLSFRASLSSDSLTKPPSSSSSLQILTPFSFATSTPYSTSVRCSSLSLKDSDAPPSQASDEKKSFVSSRNFQTEKTPSGSKRNPSLAEQLQLSTGDITEAGSPLEAPRTTRSITPKREKAMKYIIDRWAPEGSKYNRAAEILQKLKDADGSEEGVRKALENWDNSLNARDICAVISGLKWRKALAFFRWAKAEKFEVNTVVHNVLLGVIRAGRQWKVADEFGLGMINEGVELDNFTFSTLISCAVQCRAPKDALTWFDRMAAAGVVPDEVTYSTMTLVYSRLGRFDEAVELFENLLLTGWKPDKVTYGTMVNVYARAGKYQKASSLIKEMKQLGLQPDAVVYNTLITYFAREGKTGQAKRVFREMESSGIKVSEFTLSLMIDVHGRSGNVTEAFSLFERMKEENLPLDTAVYNSLLKMCGEERKLVEGESLLREMLERGLKPDEITYKSLVNLYAKEGRIDEAVQAMQDMTQAGYPADVVVYSCLIKACGASKQFLRAERFFEEMLAGGNRADDRCCGVLLSLMNMCDNDEEREPVLRCLHTAKPTLCSLVNILVAQNLDSGEVEQGVRTLLAESNSNSHRPFCNSLIDLCWSLGFKDRAESILTLADSLKVYSGSLRTHTNDLWILHLRSLSFNTAYCALGVWLDFLKSHLAEGQELPETLVIETGAGRNRGEDGNRLITVILGKLKEMNSPFDTSTERADWLEASGSSVTAWLSSGSQPQQDAEENPSDS